MNPLGKNLVTNNQLAQKQVQDARLLAADTSKGALNTASTVGRTVNKTQQDIKQTSVEAPKEQFTPSVSQEKAQPEAKDTVTTSPQTEAKAQTAAPSQNPTTLQADGAETGTSQMSSKSAEALGSFNDALAELQAGDKKSAEGIVQNWLQIDPANLPPGEHGKEIALAATALKTALGKLQAKMPNATKEQIREAAKTDPEIARWSAIADSSNNYLQEIKAEGSPAAAQAAQGAQAAQAAQGAVGANGVTGAGSPEAAGGVGAMGGMNPQNAEQAKAAQDFYRQTAEAQAQMFADNVKTMQSIMTIYQQMWAEISKARAQRHQLMLETGNTINGMIMESHVNRMKSSDNHRKAVMDVILERGK